MTDLAAFRDRPAGRPVSAPPDDREPDFGDEPDPLLMDWSERAAPPPPPVAGEPRLVHLHWMDLGVICLCLVLAMLA